MARLAARGVRAHRGRYLLAALAVLGGVTLVVTALVLQEAVTVALARGASVAAPEGELVVRRTVEVAAPFELPEAFPEPAVERVRAVPGVAATSPELLVELHLVKPGDAHVSSPLGAELGIGWNGAGSSVGADSGATGLSPLLTLVEGRVAGAGELTVDERTVAAHGLALGQPLGVETPNGVTYLTLVGTHRPALTAPLLGASLTAMPLDQLQALTGHAGQIQALRVELAAGADPGATADAVRAALPAGFEVADRTTLTAEDAAASGRYTGVMAAVLGAFAAMSFVVGLAFTHATYTSLVRQRARELALLRLVGATRRQVLGLVVAEAALVGAGAAAVGLSAGRALAATLTRWLPFADLGLVDLDPALSARTVVAAALAGVLASVVGAIGPARWAAGRHPVAALAPAPSDDAGWSEAGIVEGLGGPSTARRDLADPARSGRTDRTGWTAWTCRTGRTGRFGTGGRRVARPDTTARLVLPLVVLAASAVALSASTARAGVLTTPGLALAVVAVLGIAVGLVDLAAVVLRRALHGARHLGLVQRRVTLRLAQRSAAAGSRRVLGATRVLVLGVAFASAVAVLGATVGATLATTLDRQVRADFVVSGTLADAIEPAVAARPEVGGALGFTHGAMGVSAPSHQSSGREPDEVQELWATDLDRVNEWIDLDLRAGRADPAGILVHEDQARRLGVGVGDRLPVTFNRTGASTLVVTGIYANPSLFNGFLADRTLFAAHVSDHRVRLLVARPAPGVDRETARAAIRSVTRTYPSVEFWDDGEYALAARLQVDQLVAIVRALVSVSLGAAAIALVSAMASAVRERGREVGVLRLVGMTVRQLQACVRTESVVVGVGGAGTGAAVGVVVALVLRAAMPDAWAGRLVVPTASLAAVAAVGALLAVLSGALPARRLARRPVLAFAGDD